MIYLTPSSVSSETLCDFQSGAKINISDASCAERIVTLTGMLDQIRIAFNLMCIKFEDVSQPPPTNINAIISELSTLCQGRS